jgi:protein-S-isoprenylcysteine O-methyltransferase Ste14
MTRSSAKDKFIMSRNLLIISFLGCTPFLLAVAFDLVSLSKIRILKPSLWVAVNLTLWLSTAVAAWFSPVFYSSMLSLVIGIFITVVGFIMWTYSVFVELPLRPTYIDVDNDQYLVSNGTYALVRHPGVLWLVLTFCGVWLIRPSIPLALIFIAWSLLDIILVYIQDRWIFPRMIEKYNQYKDITPFLIPNIQSLRNCLSTITKTNYRSRND